MKTANNFNEEYFTGVCGYVQATADAYSRLDIDRERGYWELFDYVEMVMATLPSDIKDLNKQQLTNLIVQGLYNRAERNRSRIEELKQDIVQRDAHWRSMLDAKEEELNCAYEVIGDLANKVDAIKDLLF